MWMLAYGHKIWLHNPTTTSSCYWIEEVRQANSEQTMSLIIPPVLVIIIIICRFEYKLGGATKNDVMIPYSEHLQVPLQTVSECAVFELIQYSIWRAIRWTIHCVPLWAIWDPLSQVGITYHMSRWTSNGLGLMIPRYMWNLSDCFSTKCLYFLLGHSAKGFAAEALCNVFWRS